MRIYLLIVEEPFFHPFMVEELIKARKKDIVGISLIPNKSLNKPIFKQYLYQLKLFGLLPSIYFFLKTFLYKLKKNSVEAVSKKYGLPIFKVNSVNDPCHLTYLQKFHPDVMICAQGQILKKEILKIPKLACLNRHSSLLPKYAGLWPIYWAMLNDEKQIGVTVHQMTEKIDQGKIVAQDKFSRKPKDSLNSLYQKAFSLSSKVILEALEKIEKKPKNYGFTSKNIGSYFSSPKDKDIRQFRSKNLRII